MSGKLYGIGVGPGDPELLTLKAVRLIRSCDIIGIPARSADSCTAYQIALQAVPEMAQKPVLAVDVPMTTQAALLDRAYEEGCGRIGEVLEEGKQIAFLNLGDPTIYSTYMEIHQRIRKAGFQAELVSGVPSFCAVAAALDVALGSGREKIHILPGFYSLEETEKYEGTRILMKSAGRLDEVKKRLVGLEAEGRVKAWAVTDCGMEKQSVCRDIRLLDEKSGYFTTIIVKEDKPDTDK